jgi:pimeloyl-ACP methyl ester carboxylesterase
MRGTTWAEPAGELHVGSLAVRVLGRGAGPPTLLLHGLLGSNRYWGRVYDELAGHGPLLVPDLLGFGSSPRPPSGYGPDEHGRALVDTLGELGVSGCLRVVGHSLGALLALRLAATQPGLVSRVVAIAPPLFRDERHARLRIARLGPLERLFAFENRTARLFCTSLCQRRPRLAARLYARIRPEVPYPILRDATRHSWASYSETVRRVILTGGGLRWLAAARCEVLLVAGGEDRYLEPGLLDELTARHPHVQARVWPGAGHDLPLTDAERCLDAIG